ncbi:hypothetical protein E2562_016352 [Oryza meyeriana var. granulata]|uniref:Uncharacterized protein n=1 Tax=Oryza meyeriana var. granulata TaxID=110450 RepID=A0A6G1DZD5_9ORYZ|nr:hypothetical protein E2562_016352 [Oryza meyeriana var. granulata]
MEGKSRLPEITVVPAAGSGSGSGSAVDAVKAASKEPISPGSPSPAGGAAAGRGKESRPDAAVVSLPVWKLDALCQESCTSPAVMRARFPYF